MDQNTAKVPRVKPPEAKGVDPVLQRQWQQRIHDIVRGYCDRQRAGIFFSWSNQFVGEVTRIFSEEPVKSIEFSKYLFTQYCDGLTKSLSMASDNGEVNHPLTDELNSMVGLMKVIPSTQYAIFYVTGTHVSLGIFPVDGEFDAKIINRTTGAIIDRRSDIADLSNDDLETKISYIERLERRFCDLALAEARKKKNGLPISPLPAHAYANFDVVRILFKALERGNLTEDDPFWHNPQKLLSKDVIDQAERIRKGEIDFLDRPHIASFFVRHLRRFEMPEAQIKIANAIKIGRFPESVGPALLKKIGIFKEREAIRDLEEALWYHRFGEGVNPFVTCTKHFRSTGYWSSDFILKGLELGHFKTEDDFKMIYQGVEWFEKVYFYKVFLTYLPEGELKVKAKEVIAFKDIKELERQKMEAERQKTLEAEWEIRQRQNTEKLQYIRRRSQLCRVITFSGGNSADKDLRRLEKFCPNTARGLEIAFEKDLARKEAMAVERERAEARYQEEKRLEGIPGTRQYIAKQEREEKERVEKERQEKVREAEYSRQRAWANSYEGRLARENDRLESERFQREYQQQRDQERSDREAHQKNLKLFDS